MITLIEAFEKYSRRVASFNLANKKSKKRQAPHSTQLVLAGKVGWKAQPIIDRINSSSFISQIISLGFVSDQEKKVLFEHAMCQVLLGVHEGFGIPTLEAMQYGTLPIVADATSLPEVVGPAGFIVDPYDVTAIADQFYQISKLSKRRRGQLVRKGFKQARKFSWQKSATIILEDLRAIVDESSR